MGSFPLQYGDLRNLLKGCEAKRIQLTLVEFLSFAAKIASGMEFMESKRYIHMDLAARNCLVGAENLVKVADFGLTQRLADGEDTWKAPAMMKMPIKWSAIECLDDRLFSIASDVWSFGIVIWEIFRYIISLLSP